MADEHGGGPGITVLQALRRPLRFLLSAWPLRCWAYLLSGAVLGLIVLAVLTVLVGAGVFLTVVGVGLLLLLCAALSGLPVGVVERRRLRLVEPAPLPSPHPARAGDGLPAWLRTRLKERATWRELGYAALLGLVFSGAGFGVFILLAFSVALVVSPVVVAAGETVMIVPGRAVPNAWAALPFTVAGLVGLALSAYAAGLVCGAQVRTAWLLLGPRDEELTERVIELTRSRARLADAFEAERRRIERDLHDGAQQQLVALAMTLGLAEMELSGTGGPAAELVARGRAEARRALDQLRELVRGIHPQVLTDHGLAAAVAEVALRHPVPVTVDIDLPHRPPGPVETMAYFTVTEALTNAAKHSGASEISVVGRLAQDPPAEPRRSRPGTDGTAPDRTPGERLILVITDDGRGGADPSRGTGLHGIGDRLAILEGRLVVSSPVGGPTQLRVEVPCSA
ncbi:sensor domain-containing protein [Streptomyces olivoreticuli]